MTEYAVPSGLVIGELAERCVPRKVDCAFGTPVRRQVKPSNPGQTGKVVDEQPAGRTRAPEGSTVTIYVGVDCRRR